MKFTFWASKGSSPGPNFDPIKILSLDSDLPSQFHYKLIYCKSLYVKIW